MGAESHQNLLEDLEQIAKEGITVDVARLKEDMCAQFADPNEWVREYVVNVYDAHARHCSLDDGLRMDRQRVADFMTLYRSSKSQTNNRKPIGRHGIGKLSIAAVPGQCSFNLLTSNGKEAWKMETGRLLDQTPISILPVAPPPPRGTRFEIVKGDVGSQTTYRKRASIKKNRFLLLANYIHEARSRFNLLPWWNPWNSERP